MYVMMTVPRKYIKNGRKWLEYFNANDCHKWVIALEHGKGGLEHWQVRFKVRGCDTKEGKQQFMNWWKLNCPQAHIEFTENWCDYERKEGWFVTSEDNKAILSVRFGVLRHIQKDILDTVETQNDRQVDVWYDPRGNHGKSWLSLHLFEKGKAFLVFTSQGNKASSDICSGYRGQPYIILDIPRSQTIPKELYEIIERIKDGIVHDSRYHDNTRNIRGAKVIIFTNKKLDTKQLSEDRWRLHGFGREL